MIGIFRFVLVVLLLTVVAMTSALVTIDVYKRQQRTSGDSGEGFPVLLSAFVAVAWVADFGGQRSLWVST